MVSILLICHSSKLARSMRRICTYVNSTMADEPANFSIITDDITAVDSIIWKDVCDTIKNKDIIIAEIVSDKDLKKIKGLRKKLPYSILMIISDNSISAEKYVTPELLPFNLLLRPFEEGRARKCVNEIFKHHYTNSRTEDCIRMFYITVKDEKCFYNYNEISYFEAKDKKIIMNYRDEKLLFNGTLKKIEVSLPKHFIRCHRSFLINRMFIKKISLSNNDIILSNDVLIPISQKYKKNIERLL